MTSYPGLGAVLRDQAVEQHVVGGEGVGLAVGQHAEGLLVIGAVTSLRPSSNFASSA